MKYLLSLGSNLGDKISNIKQAIQKLKNIATIYQCASLYHSEALLLEGAPAEWALPFINTCVLIDSELTPQQLLSAVQQIEVEMGRPAERKKWSPRIIDIDIILAENITNDINLQIPHPELHKRDFVLQPSKEILGDNLEL